MPSASLTRSADESVLDPRSHGLEQGCRCERNGVERLRWNGAGPEDGSTSKKEGTLDYSVFGYSTNEENYTEANQAQSVMFRIVIHHQTEVSFRLERLKSQRPDLPSTQHVANTIKLLAALKCLSSMS